MKFIFVHNTRTLLIMTIVHVVRESCRHNEAEIVPHLLYNTSSITLTLYVSASV